MRKQMAVAVLAACVMAPVVQAGPAETPFEPALMMKLEFGGVRQPELGMALRLNHSSKVRQSLAGFGSSDALSWQSQERSHGLMFQGPALAQLDFKTTGAGRATLMGLPLVTRHVRSQNEGASTEVPADGSAPVADGTWYDYGTWGWKGWSLAAAGVAGVYLLASDDKSDNPATTAGGGETAGSEEESGDEGGDPLLGCDPTGITGECI